MAGLNPFPENPEKTAGPHVSVSTWGLRMRQGGFASVKLGPTGWLALLSPGAVLGLLIARLTGGSFIVFGVIGALVIWLAAISLDRVFSGNRPTNFDVEPPLSSAVLERVEEAARYAGIKFEHLVRETSENNNGGAQDPESVFVTKTKYVARLKNIVMTYQDE